MSKMRISMDCQRKKIEKLKWAEKGNQVENSTVRDESWQGPYHL